MWFPTKNRNFWSILCYQKDYRKVIYEHNIDLHLLFVDIRQAFDSVRGVKLYEATRDIGIPLKLIKLTKVAMRYPKENLSMIS